MNIQHIQNIVIPIINALSEIADIKGILCFGSYAVGTYDKYSDLDLFVFCHPEIIGSSIRHKIFNELDGITNYQANLSAVGWENQWNQQCDCFCLHNIQYDIIYNTIHWIKTVVRKVKEEGCISIPELQFRPYTILGLLDNSVILFDPESILKEIISNLYPYPSSLKKTLISRSISIIHSSLEDLTEYIKKGVGNTAFHFHLGRIIDSFGTILFAINEKYDPAIKRVEEVYRQLRIVPNNFLERYTKILETPLTQKGRQEIVNDLNSLIEEVEQLINQR